MSGAALPVGRLSLTLAFLVALCLAPAAAAAPVHATLVYTGSVLLEGDGRWQATDGAIDLYGGASVPPYELTVQADTVTVVTQEWQYRETRVAPLYTDERSGEREETRSVHHDAAVTLTHLRPHAHAALSSTAWTVDASFADATLSNARHVWATADPDEETARPGGDLGDAPRTLWPHSVHLEDQVLLEPRSIRLTASGDLLLTLFEGDLAVTSAAGTATYTSGERQEETDLTLGQTYHSSILRLLIVTFHGATLSGAWGGASFLAATAPTVVLDGALTVPAARGDILVDRVLTTAHDEVVDARGALVLQPTVDAAADVLPYGMEDKRIRYAGGRLAASGDAATVHVAATPIRDPFSSQTDLAVVGVAGVGLVAFALAAWRYAPLALAALYSRIEQGAILDNPTRAQIYHIVCANPGISARKVHQLADASWGTVVHHLTKLAASGHITVIRNGRAKGFYENHGKWDGQQRPLALLASSRTRTLAEHIARNPGRDQAQLVARLGLPQSTVSYHLLKLEEQGLVSKQRDGAALAYYATTQLRLILERLHANGAPQPVGGGSA